MTQLSAEPPRPEAARPLRVAMLGCGTVGTRVAQLIEQRSEDLRERIGRPLELVGIAVRDPAKKRDDLDPALFTGDAAGLVATPDIDIVIELIGGIEPSRTLVLDALRRGSSVVTANKALLAAHGEEIFAAAEESGVDVYFEAAVAGAIPIVRPLRESLVGDEITAVIGIVNGTTNYILDKMTSERMDFDQALAKAQELGYAERYDPSADVEGYDAAAKAAILASLAFHSRVNAEDVYREGITDITIGDIEAAASLDNVIKLLAIAEIDPQGRISVRVHPAMVARTHPLAGIKGAYNAILIQAANAGRLMFMGPGAGGIPTASAVAGDLVTVARNRLRGVAGPPHSVYARRALAPMSQTRSRYFLRLRVADEPGVLAGVASVLAAHHVSLASVQQAQEKDETGEADLALVTHEAREQDVLTCMDELAATDYVRETIRMLRVEV